MRRLAPLSFLLFSALLALLPIQSQAAAGRGGGGGGGRGYSGGGGGYRGGGVAYHGGGGYSAGYRGGSYGGAYYGGGYRGGYYGGHYGGYYGYRGGYYGARYGYGWGLGFGVGIGWPYYGWGYPYGYSSYYDYPSAAYYPAYDSTPVTYSAPVAYSAPATYSAPAAVPQVNVYTPSQAPVYRERQDPPAGRDANGQLTSHQSNMYLIAFPNGSVQVAVAYWTDNGTLHYVTNDKVQKTVPISAIDRAVTQQLNRERGIAFNIP